MSAISPSAASARSKASANTAFPKAMRRASRCSSTPRPGSSAIIRRCSAPPSSTASRWASISRPSSCAMRAQHGVEVRGADVNFSTWDCTLEPAADGAQRPFAVRLGFRQIQGLNEGRAGEAHRGARQWLCQHRAAGRGRRSLALHDRAARRGRCVPLARARPPRRAVGRAAARHDRHRQTGEGRAQAKTNGASPHRPVSPSLSPHERRTVPGAGGRTAAHAALRARGGGLRDDRPVAEGAPGALLPRRPHAARRHPQRGAPQRRPAAGLAGHRRRPRAGAAAAGHRQGRRLHDARGRDRHRQHHRLAEGVRSTIAAPS